MSNNYRSPDTEIVGREGQMFNEATLTDRTIEFEDFGIFANDNTYPVTFNPMYNRPKTKNLEYEDVRRPLLGERTTRPVNEPPVALTDGMFYLNNAQCKPPPVLPPYLQKPEDLAKIQGLAREYEKGNIIYGPTHEHTVTHIIY